MLLVLWFPSGIISNEEVSRVIEAMCLSAALREMRFYLFFLFCSVLFFPSSVASNHFHFTSQILCWTYGRHGIHCLHKSPFLAHARPASATPALTEQNKIVFFLCPTSMKITSINASEKKKKSLPLSLIQHVPCLQVDMQVDKAP